MKLYFNPMSRATRVRWILEELGVPHEVVPVDFMKGEQKKPEYLKIHPLGVLPAIQDGNFTMFESAAIVMHLADKYPEKGLAPALGTTERAEYYQWIWFAMTDAEMQLTLMAQHGQFLPEAERVPAVAAAASKRFKTVISVIQDRLQGREYIVGDKFTAADIVVAGVLGFGAFLNQLGDHPGLQQYVGRLMSRPAAKKAFGR